MTLPPAQVLGAIIAAHTTLFTGPHRLAVQDRTARLALASGSLPHPSTQGVMDLLPDALPAPRPEVLGISINSRFLLQPRERLLAMLDVDVKGIRLPLKGVVYHGGSMKRRTSAQ
jgi:hypothetical protein